MLDGYYFGMIYVIFFKPNTAYEMRISDWSSDVCSSDLLKTYSGQDHVNVGYGDDVTILELAETVKDVVGFEGEIVLDSSKPDGTPRKLMAADRLRALGWHPSMSLRDGITRTYAAFVAQIDRKSTRLQSSHKCASRMQSSATKKLKVILRNTTHINTT